MTPQRRRSRGPMMRSPRRPFSLDLATIRRAEVEDGATADELASAQHNVDNAAFSLDTAKLKRDESYAGATADEIEAQRGQVQLAELALARAQGTVSRTPCSSLRSMAQ